MSTASPAGHHELPAEFLVGASTAAHQIEGGNVNNNWWAFEHRAGATVEHVSGDCADSYHRWVDDLDLVAELGLGAYRFSLEWSRLEPARGEFSRAARDHYGRIIAGAIERGIEPVVTLHHFTDPLWFSRAGGWTADDAVERFFAYVDWVAPILAPVRWIVTINEPNMAAIMARLADRDVQVDDVAGAPLPLPHPGVADALEAAHRAAAQRLRQLVPTAQVGWSIANQAIGAIAGGEAAAERYREHVEDRFVRVGRDDDFVGVQAYTRNVFGPRGMVRDDPVDERTLTGWEYWPGALETALRHTRELVGDVPLLVTENGIATADDDRRIAYTAAALAGMQRAMADGIDVRGYLHWSLLDNYEWGSFTPTFGLVAWDPETFERRPKPSARWLGDLARSRQIAVAD